MFSINFARFVLAFFLGLMLFLASQLVGARLRRQTGHHAYLPISRAIGAMLWVGMFLLIFR